MIRGKTNNGQRNSFNIKYVIIFSLAGIAAVALKLAFKPSELIFGASPDVVLIYVAAVAFIFGERVGGTVGLFCGFISAAAGGYGVCIQPIFYMLCGYFAPIAARELFEWDGYEPFPVLLTSAGLTVAMIFATIFGAMFTRENFNLLQILSENVVPEAISTMILGAVVGVAAYTVLYFKEKKTRLNKR